MSYHYAQINDEGYVVCDSHLSGEVNLPNMIQVPESFSLTNKRYNLETKEWEDYIPPEPTPAPEPTEEEIFMASVLLSQAEIQETQANQDEVLAAILLNQIEGGE